MDRGRDRGAATVSGASAPGRRADQLARGDARRGGVRLRHRPVDGRGADRVGPGGTRRELVRQQAVAAVRRRGRRRRNRSGRRPLRQLFGDLAHEIRTPVAVVDAYIEALEDGVRTLSPQTAAVLRDQTRRLVRFSDDVAALAQAEESATALSCANVDAAQLVRRCVAAIAGPYERKRVALCTEVSGAPLRLWADEQRLAQVLDNLLDNALRHTARGGRVTVSAHAERDRIVVRVADNGEGVDIEHLPHLFERFYRADSARDRDRGGAGIGLAIAKAYVEKHRGHIAVTSAGRAAGTAFTITLPIGAPERAYLPVAADATS
jgi:two-component system, OmpR family, sensor histidine kinase BaeS